MCHAQHAIAGELECGVPDSIALERGARPVKVVPVELDDESTIAPHGVDLEAGDVNVDCRSRQVISATEVEEPALQL
jgi:hypothetical protein